MKISRRFALSVICAAPSVYIVGWWKELLTWPKAFADPATQSSNTAPVTVHEITMAAPDIVRVEIRDGQVVKGPLVGPLAAPDPGAYDRFLTRINPKNGKEEKAQVVSPSKSYLKFMDQAPTHYLNRVAADNPKNYGQIGLRKVIQVYRRSEPYDYGQVVSSQGGIGSATSMRHYLYLKLDGVLQPGAYAIDFPTGTGLSKAQFTFDPKFTRACSIRATQVGHRPNDQVKYGYVSLWVPGMPNEGAVDFEFYGLKSFHIIDEEGRSQFSGPIVKRIGPTDIEQLSGWPENIRYASLNRPPKLIKAITRANPGVVTSPGHGFSDGEFVMLRGIGGMPQLEGGTFKIIAATKDTFSLQTTKGVDVNTSSYPDYNMEAYLSGYNGLIYATYLANRAATFVYGLDYSAWRPRDPGLYRIYIPGHGVSDTFRIDEAIWYKVARNAAAGEYHQRNGIALDGRFGYTRGVTFRDGVNDTKIYWSRLPAIFSSEWAVIGQAVPSSEGANPKTWLTSNRANEWFGGVMDAGDWDDSTYEHVPVYYWLLDLGYEKLPAGSRNISFGLPKSHEILDPELYTGTDTLPDPVHQAIWYLDAFRRLQRADGAVGGGLGFDGGGKGRKFEASSISRSQAFIYAADPASNYTYAMGAAKLAIVLKSAGFDTLSNVWAVSAEKAWAWAEPLYQSSLTDGKSRDAYFIDELNLKTNARWSDTQYNTAMTALQRLATSRRFSAAGTLFRLTEREPYRKITEGHIISPIAGDEGIGQWEYVYSAAANPTLKRRALESSGGFENYARSSIIPYTLGRIGYKNFGKALGPWIANGGPMAQALQAFVRTGAHGLLGLMQDGMAVTLGANQTGFCYTNGIGHRTLARTTLHVDANFMGLSEAPSGITHFGWDQPGVLLRFLNFSTDAPANFTAETPTGKYEADYGTTKIYEPYRLSMPFAEQTVQNPYVVYHMEYQVQKSIIPQEIIAIWLHSWDGNTATEFTNRTGAN